MSLLDKAKADTHRKNKVVTDEHIELARAFVNQDIGISAVNEALGHTRTSMQGYVTVCRALREENIRRINKLKTSHT